MLEQETSRPAPTFLTLPSEIRLKIYAMLLLTYDTTQHIRVTDGRSVLLDGEGVRPSVAILRTCKLVDREATCLFYRSYYFETDILEFNIHWAREWGPGTNNDSFLNKMRDSTIVDHLNFGGPHLSYTYWYGLIIYRLPAPMKDLLECVPQFEGRRFLRDLTLMYFEIRLVPEAFDKLLLGTVEGEVGKRCLDSYRHSRRSKCKNATK